MDNKKESIYSNTTDRLIKGNSIFLDDGINNNGNISREIRHLTAVNGQSPYAIIVTCSDSRVVPEHIFNAGIGELFVVDNAGNVISDFDLGSIEYGAEHLLSDTIIVMGHTGCGAVAAAIKNNAHGYMKKVTDQIQIAIGDEKDQAKAEIKNVEYSIEQIMKSEIITGLVNEGKLTVKGVIYDTDTGDVEFL